MPEKDKEGFSPVGKGQDPPEEGEWLRPGATGGPSIDQIRGELIELREPLKPCVKEEEEWVC